MDKKVEKIVFHICAYTLLISMLFYLFAAIAGMESISMSIGRYFIIIGFSILISLAEIIFSIKSLPKFLCYLIHFSSLFIAFLVVFILINDMEFKSSFILSSFIIFTLCYFMILGLTILYSRIKFKTKKTKPRAEETAKYTSKFS